jgi:hypothetical protein
MAVPSNPSVTTLCTAALKQGGIPSPSTTQIAELAEDGLQNVKTQIWLKNPTDHILQSEFYIVMAEGKSSLSMPSNLDAEVWLDVYAGPETHAGTAQTGSVSSITLAADFSAEETAIQGLYIFLTGGTGSGQYREISAWENTTKIATPHSPWTTAPGSATTYLIGTQKRRLLREDEATQTLGQLYPNIGYPQTYSKTGVSPLSGSSPAYRIWPTPDHGRYACILTYIPNLTMLDEDSSLFIKHLRERRALWIQGLKCEVMQRYDDDRYPQALAVWNAMLMLYGTHNYNQVQAEGHR